MSNSEFDAASSAKIQKKPRLYVRVSALDDSRLEKLYRTAALNPGECEIVVFDTKSGKYSALKGASLNPTESVIERLRAVFSSENVIFK